METCDVKDNGMFVNQCMFLNFRIIDTKYSVSMKFCCHMMLGFLESFQTKVKCHTCTSFK